MKRVLFALVLIGLLASCAAAQEKPVMQMFVARDTMDMRTAQRLCDLLGAEFVQAEWALMPEGEESLAELVLQDRAPALAVCSPGEARIWAQEGLLAALHRHIADQRRIAHAVLESCVQDEQLFIAPLLARRRQMAVNAGIFAREHLDYMLGEPEHTIWVSTEFQQILEEFALNDQQAFELWPLQAENSAPVEALVQSVYGGSLLEEDGQAYAGDAGLRSGVMWLRDVAACGLAGMAESRQDALSHFLRGETAVFIDWTQELAARHADELEKNGVEVIAMPYPSAGGLPVRSFDLIGVCAFKGGESARDLLAAKAIAFLHADAQAQIVLGSRDIWHDDARWLPDPACSEAGATMRRLFCEGMNSVLGGEREPDEMLRLLAAAMKTAEGGMQQEKGTEEK